jgi:hypothetical protein
MSPYYQNGNGSDDRGRDRKLSGFTKCPREEAKGDAVAEGGRSTRLRGTPSLTKQGNRLWVSLLVDVVLLAIVSALVVGCVFGYRALRELYAPTWETRNVVFTVKMENIPPEMVRYDQKKGQYTIKDNPIWSSDQTNADQLGTVTEVRTVLVSGGAVNTVTLYLEVEAKAYYREGKGYRMGETMLLAGSTGTYRLEGLTADGIIISMHERVDETDSAADTMPTEAWDVPANGDDNARG